MSHIFVSYAHSDKIYLDRLVAWLRDHEFAEQELWYDPHIEGGNNWRDEITTALNEAYVLLVIATANSAKSLYCTYEWAYAMGQGIPTIPLVFDNLAIADVPAPLTSRQFINCTEDIPEYLKDQIRQLRSAPPQVAAINRLVYETIYDTHRRFFILGWIGNGLGALGSVGPEFREGVIGYFVGRASEAHQTLQALMTDKAFAFSGKQYRLCWKLIDFLQEFSRLEYKVENYLQDYLFSQFDTTWLPAFEYFERDGNWWRNWMRPHFDLDLEDESNRMEVLAEMMRVFPTLFPTLEVHEANILIQNRANDQKRKQK